MTVNVARRTLLRCGFSVPLALGASLGSTSLAAGVGTTDLTAEQALARLKEGNEKFVAETAAGPAVGTARRLELAEGQAPFAAVVACSDSRVAPELLFGVGLGEIFTIRNAGNVVEGTALGSLQYAVGPLGVPLIVVVGHENCGAVAAAVEVVQRNTAFPVAIGEMIEPILPAVIGVQKQPGDLVDNAVRANVRRHVLRLREATDPIMAEPIKSGRLKVVGARYDLHEGLVEFFGS